MELKYDVLWVDDQLDSIKESIESMHDLFVEEGFILKIDEKDSITPDGIDNLVKTLDSHNPYDLIIFDYDLGTASENGVKIAKKLRNSIYTDMIFYSGGKNLNDLRKELYDEKIDGVFIIDRTQLYDDIRPIIYDHIKKISSLNGARGMVMSEWSDIDIALREKLKQSLKSLDDTKRQQEGKKILERLTKKVNEKSKKLKQLQENRLQEKLDDIYKLIYDPTQCEFDIIRRSLGALNEKGSIYDNDEYVHKIQMKRNELAHKPFIEIEKYYKHKTFKQLRKDLIKLKREIGIPLDS